MAIGLYPGAAHMTADQINAIAEIYAWAADSQHPNEPMDPRFPHLTQANTDWVTIGVQLATGDDVCSPK